MTKINHNQQYTNIAKKIFTCIINIKVPGMNDVTKRNLTLTGGASAGLGTYVLSNYYGNKYVQKYFCDKIKMNLTPQDAAEYQKAIQLTLKNEGFDKYGVKICDASTFEGANTINQILDDYRNHMQNKVTNAKNPLSKYLYKKLAKIMINNVEKRHNAIFQGKNACAMRITKKGTNEIQRLILIDMKKLPQVVFHELGHHQNHRSLNKIADYFLYCFLRNQKYISCSILGILLVSLFTNKTQNPDSNKSNPLYPVGKLIKDNCGKLAALACIPILAEETIASVNGQKLGEKYLPKKQWQSLTRAHLWSFSSYVKFTAIAGLSVYLANLVHDFIVSDAPKLGNKMIQRLKKEDNLYKNKISMDVFINK